jgi:eukaryotic-like serine/threonine-protein kinase
MFRRRRMSRGAPASTTDAIGRPVAEHSSAVLHLMTETGLTAIDSAPVCVAHAAKPSCRARQWELVEFAGLGSLAHIYRARPVEAPADRPAAYAVKMLRPCWQDDGQAIRLLQREALVGQSISHPHLVPILAAHVVEPPRLLVMPWLDGASLGVRLAEGQPFGVPEALWLARQTAEALDALHAAGWMHGDISPGNIHVSPTGHVTLLDFNFARRHDEFGSAVDRPIMGSYGYLAPEYLTSALRPDIRSDIYSLGAVLFEVFASHRPFEAETLAELAMQHKQAAPPDLSRLAPHVAREVVQLIRRMMANEPLRRPQTPRELVDRLVALEIATFSERAV